LAVIGSQTVTLGNKRPTEQEKELERVRKRLRGLLGARWAIGLNEAEEREYAELCARELTLIEAPAIVSVTGSVIDLDAGVVVARQRQDQ
jgi:hypothetical protein